jgi:hypothetical protein
MAMAIMMLNVVNAAVLVGIGFNHGIEKWF